jgi:translation initiation factor 3 subunit K
MPFQFRYQFNPHLLHPETVTKILVKSPTVFPSPSAVHNTLSLDIKRHIFNPDDQLYRVHPETHHIFALLESARYTEFWTTLASDDLYVDLCANVVGFEDLIRIRIAGEVGKAFREIDLEVYEDG